MCFGILFENTKLLKFHQVIKITQTIFKRIYRRIQTGHIDGLVQDYSFLHAKQWIPGDEKSIFTVVIH